MGEYNLPPQTEKDIENLSDAMNVPEGEVIKQGVNQVLLEQGRGGVKQRAEHKRKIAQEAEKADDEEKVEE